MIQGEQVQDSELSTQAVIYLGPSSMSLMVAEVVQDRIRLLDFLQQPVPMARDIFRFHRISRHTMDRCKSSETIWKFSRNTEPAAGFPSGS